MTFQSADDAVSRGDEGSPTVLVAEDEVIIRIAIADCLQDRGLKVFEAGSSAEAIEILKAHDGITLVFSDIRMPGRLNGFGLARWIREYRPDVAIVLTSGEVGKTEIAAEKCADELFFKKPYDLHFVAAQIFAMANARKTRH